MQESQEGPVSEHQEVQLPWNCPTWQMVPLSFGTSAANGWGVGVGSMCGPPKMLEH